MPQAIKKSTKNTQPQMRKRHWALGLSVILGGSWITHTTTATIASPDDLKPQAVVVSESRIENANQTIQESTAPTQSTGELENAAQQLVLATNTVPHPPKELLRSEFHEVKRGESLGLIFRRKSLNMALPHQISQHEVASQLVSLSIGKKLEFKFDQNDQLRAIEYPITALTQLNVDIKDSIVVDASVKKLASKSILLYTCRRTRRA